MALEAGIKRGEIGSVPNETSIYLTQIPSGDFPRRWLHIRKDDSFMKAICLFDWDGTLRRGVTALDWMVYLESHLPNAKKSAQKMQKLLKDYHYGDVNYQYLVQKAAELYAKCVADASVAELSCVANKYVSEDTKNLFSFVPELFEQIHAHSYETVIVSGAPSEVLNAYSRIMPIDRIYGLIIKQVDERFTGVIQQNHGLMSKKKDVVNALLAEGCIIKLAAGNSVSDFPLLEYAENRYLISDEQEVKSEINATFIDTKHASSIFKGAL